MKMDVADILSHDWRVIHGIALPWQRKTVWHFSTSDLVVYSCIAIVLTLVGRCMFSPTKIRWHHATSTIRLKSPQGGEVQLADLCKSVTPPCHLNPVMRNRHLQTLYFMLDKRVFPLYFRRMVFPSQNPEYPGSFAIDFTSAPFPAQDPGLPPRTMYHKDGTHQPLRSNDSRPMLVVLHGLCGGSHEQYLQHVLAPLAASKQKWEACVVLSRGCGQSAITGGGMYYAHATSDLRQIIKWIRDAFPNRTLYGVGFSMGANILTRYIAEEGHNCALRAAAVVSNPWNLETTALHLRRSFWGRWLYSPAMAANLMDVYYQHAEKIETIEGLPLDTKPASQVRLIHEYDRHIQCPTWGFPTERTYYRRASSSDSVLEVRIPFWAINAEDDPIVGEESLPTGEFEASPFTVLCTTDGGGHLGWFQPDGRRWYARAVVSFFQKMHTVQNITTMNTQA